jgi:intraflagellar transport protein 140
VAAKLYIEIQEPMLALKAVIKGGDPEKVIKFANFARSSEGYVLAANFLQNADWHSNPELIKKITQYYKKAKRFDALGNFYVSLAMGEIDEFKNYNKALNAIQVAKKYAAEGSDTALLGKINEKINYIEKYLSAKERLDNEPKVIIYDIFNYFFLLFSIFF